MSSRTEILAIVPARGGSKGIPGKNLVPLAGKPLLVHTLDQANASPLIRRLVVSTDSVEIAAVAKESGAEVILRPSEISGDEAPSESALLHCVDSLKASEEYEPDLVVFLQATSPIRRAGDIDRAIKTLREGGYDSVFSASPTHGFVWELQGANGPVPLDYDPAHRPMRQKVGDRLVENGSVYVFKPWVLRQTGLRLGGKVGVYRMGFLEALQIDEPFDLDLAGWILQCRASQGSLPQFGSQT